MGNQFRHISREGEMMVREMRVGREGAPSLHLLLHHREWSELRIRRLPPISRTKITNAHNEVFSAPIFARHLAPRDQGRGRGRSRQAGRGIHLCNLLVLVIRRREDGRVGRAALPVLVALPSKFGLGEQNIERKCSSPKRGPQFTTVFVTGQVIFFHYRVERRE